MAYGGGTFTTTNKILPGAYINFISTSSSALVSGRGNVAMPLVLDWGVDDEIFVVTAEDFARNSLAVFGYPTDDEKMKPLRELFKNASVLYAYRLNSGAKAENELCAARYSGTRGNDLTVAIAVNADEPGKYDFTTYLGSTEVDAQTVGDASELKANDYVTWKEMTTVEETAGMPLSGGSNGEEVSGAAYQAFLDKAEACAFNVLGCPSTEAAIVGVFDAYTIRMRDDVGVKFQLVRMDVETNPADHEGIITIANKVLDAGESPAAMVYWVAGAEAACAVNKSLTNTIYNGEYKVDVNYTQGELEKATQTGKFIFHRHGDKTGVLTDINSLKSLEKGEDFRSNQVIRVIDQIANDVATLFIDKYLGKAPNDASGRTSLWNDIVRHHQELEKIRAIENFNPGSVEVLQGDGKKKVIISDAITPVAAMEQLYMTVVVA